MQSWILVFLILAVLSILTSGHSTFRSVDMDDVEDLFVKKLPTNCRFCQGEFDKEHPNALKTGAFTCGKDHGASYHTSCMKEMIREDELRDCPICDEPLDDHFVRKANGNILMRAAASIGSFLYSILAFPFRAMQVIFNIFKFA